MVTLGHIQNFIPLSLSGIIDIFFLSKFRNTKDINFTTVLGVLLNKWQKPPSLKYFTAFIFFPCIRCYSWVLEHSAVTALWEHNRPKTQELWDRVSFSQVSCETFGSYWAVSVTNISIFIIILELLLYYQLHHFDSSIKESPQKQQKQDGIPTFKNDMRKT